MHLTTSLIFSVIYHVSSVHLDNEAQYYRASLLYFLIIIQYFALFGVNRFIMKKKQWNLKRFIKIYLNTHGSRAHISSFI